MEKLIMPAIEKTLAPLIEQVRTGSVIVWMIVSALCAGMLFFAENFTAVMPDFVGPIAHSSLDL